MTHTPKQLQTCPHACHPRENCPYMRDRLPLIDDLADQKHDLLEALEIVTGAMLDGGDLWTVMMDAAEANQIRTAVSKAREKT